MVAQSVVATPAREASSGAKLAEARVVVERGEVAKGAE